MIGTFCNVAGIVLGGVVGLVSPRRLSVAQESWFRVLLGAFTVFYGLRLTWQSLEGSFFRMLLQIVIVVLALMLGKIVGQLLHLQKTSNKLGVYAREQFAAIKPGRKPGLSMAMNTCAALFCAAPLGILGAITDGLGGYPAPLIIKGVMEGLAALGFVQILGWGVLLSALPVLALQGTITLVSALYLLPFLEQHQLLNSVNATAGLLIFSVALVILDIKKIELADYYPSLLFAPLLAWLIHW
jgi:hypothetical protein